MTSTLPKVCNHGDTLHVFTDDQHFFVACCARDAARLFNQEFSLPDKQDLTTGIRWQECRDDSEFTFYADDGPIKKTYGEWAREIGRGYFASRDF